MMLIIWRGIVIRCACLVSEMNVENDAVGDPGSNRWEKEHVLLHAELRNGMVREDAIIGEEAAD